MKVHKFTIPGRLDGMNEIIAANRKSPYIGAKEKRTSCGMTAPRR